MSSNTGNTGTKLSERIAAAEGELLGATTVCKLLELSRPTLMTYAEDELVPRYLKIGRRYVWNKSDLVEWARAKEREK